MNAKERSEVFDFRGGDCLYRDHHGHRVLADVEGSGEFRVCLADGPAVVIVDNILQSNTAGTFNDSLLVTTQSAGDFRINMRQGTLLNPIKGEDLGDRVKGCGFVLTGSISCVDRSHGSISRIGYPVPFFREVEGDGLEVAMIGESSVLVDSFDVSDQVALRERAWTVQNGSKLSTLSSGFPDRTQLTAEVFSHLNAASWQVRLPEGCDGLIIWKRYDAFHGRQRARVLVDGNVAGWWYEPWQDREHRWRWGRFGIEERDLPSSRDVTLTIEPPAGAPLWSVSRMEIWGLVGGLAHNGGSYEQPSISVKP